VSAYYHSLQNLLKTWIWKYTNL